MSGPLFGIVPAGQPLIIEPTSAPSSTSLLFLLPFKKTFSHVVVFLLPNVVLPDETAAAIYITTTPGVSTGTQSNAMLNFRFLGAIGPGKESAIFKISPGAYKETSSSPGAAGGGIMIGISLEPVHSVARHLEELAASKLNPSTTGPGSSQSTTAILAQRIIQNAFNFLSSFSGADGPGGTEVVPLRAFEDWWRKFESRVRSDPSFLETPE